MKLIAINPPSTITESQIPDAIARDTEVASAIAAHLAAPNPHSNFLFDGSHNWGGSIDTLANGVFSGDANLEGIGNRGWHFFASKNNRLGTGIYGVELALSDTTHSALYRYSGAGIWNSWVRLWTSNFGTPVWQSPSDQKLKRTIRPIPSALQLILESKPVSFEFKAGIRNSELFADKFQRGKMHYGFIAQDFPLQDLVSEKSNGYLGIDYIEIIPFLVRAIQEQQEQIEALKLQLGGNK